MRSASSAWLARNKFHIKGETQQPQTKGGRTAGLSASMGTNRDYKLGWEHGFQAARLGGGGGGGKATTAA